MTDDEIIAVVQAHKEGKPIQSRHMNDPYWMNNPTEFQWNFGVYEYRVAPEPSKPREWWLSLDQWGNPRCTPQNTPHQGYIHVREVIE